MLPQLAPAEFWETMTLDAPVTINLLSLPYDSAGGVELFDGDLPPGAYVRRSIPHFSV